MYGLVIGYEKISLPQNENINMGGFQRRIMKCILTLLYILNIGYTVCSYYRN